jgi:hypothetical protein
VLRFQLLQLAKFAGVLLFAGGAVGSFAASEVAARKAAVHRLGSPGLLVLWAAGFYLARTLGWSPGQLWITGAFATTLVIHLVLTWSAARAERRTAGAALAVAALFVVTLGLMIWKPTWEMIR